MARVRILKATNFGQPFAVGDVVDVDPETARRWRKHGIAVSESSEGEPEADEEVAAAPEEAEDEPTDEEPEGEPEADEKPKRGKRQASEE